jgi:hypothetical protein
MDHGSCDNYKIFWYFNQLDKQCDRFYYGGCDGNQNRFDSKENCEMSCKMSQEEKSAFLKLPKTCIQALDYGLNCMEPAQKWYFDTEMKTCYPFEYTGCGIEETNRFENLDDCNHLCTDVLNKYLNSSSNLTSIESDSSRHIESSLKTTTKEMSHEEG